MSLTRINIVLRVCLLLVSCCGPVALLADEKEVKAPAEVDMQWAVKVPMRDGISLNATIFRPHAQKEPQPVIFTLTPYIGDSYLDRAMYFARHGYVYALV